MNRRALAEFTHSVGAGLSLDSENYKQWVFRYTFLELEKDLGVYGDITTKSVLRGYKSVKAQVIARSNGTFAGGSEIQYFLVDAHPNFRPSMRGEFSLDLKVKDGESFQAGDVLLELRADASDLLAVERVVLNLLTRMSSVATYASRLRALIGTHKALLCPTRKTLWGLLDKKACFVAGIGTHRLNLADAIMVKDNHLALFDRKIGDVVRRIADSGIEGRFVEVEIDSLKEVVPACKAISECFGELKMIPVLMFDNFAPGDLVKALDLAKKAGYYDDLLFEASGGIRKKNLLEYAETGVDIISMGALTQEVPVLDLGMEVV